MTGNAAETLVVLLVEDDKVLQTVLETALSSEGFKVTLAGSGADAVAVLDSQGAEFRCVITDVRLGKGPDGWAVARKAREVSPSIPVVYMSGDSANEWSVHGVPESVILQKPFVPAQLVIAIATLLNEAAKASAVRDGIADVERPPSTD